MVIVFIGAADKIGQLHGAVVDDHRDIQIDRPQRSDVTAKAFANLFGAGKRQRDGNFVQFFHLDAVKVVIAAQYQRHRFPVPSLHDQGLDALLGGNLEETADVFNGMLSGGGDLFQFLFRCLAGLRRGRRRGHFDIGGIFTIVRKHDLVFAGIRQDVKFMGDFSAYIAAVGQYRPVAQPQPVEDAAVSGVHLIIGFLKGGFR